MNLQMNVRKTLLVMLYCGSVFGKAGAVAAQYPAALGQPGFNSSYPSYQSRPTVSPYLNLLGPNQTVVTSYQTLVRPMIDERDATVRQSANIQQLQQRQRQARVPGKGSPQDERAVQAARFLNYSHYYGEWRR